MFNVKKLYSQSLAALQLLILAFIFVGLYSAAQFSLSIRKTQVSGQVLYAQGPEEGGGDFNNFNLIPSDVCQGDAAESPACRSNVDGGTSDNSIYGPSGALTKIANLLAIVVGIAAVIVIVIAGFQYTLSGGDSNKVSAAKNAIIYALVGVVVTVLARQIIVYVLSKFA